MHPIQVDVNNSYGIITPVYLHPLQVDVYNSYGIITCVHRPLNSSKCI